MPDDLEAMIGRADTPRRLPPELRARLSDVLLAETSTIQAPDDAVTARLADVDGERPLHDPLRNRLHEQLQEATRAPAGRRPRRGVLLGTAAGLVTVLAAGLAVSVAALSGTADRGTVAGDLTVPTATTQPTIAPRVVRPSATHGAIRPGPTTAPRPESGAPAGLAAGPTVVNGSTGAKAARGGAWLSGTPLYQSLTKRLALTDSASAWSFLSPAFGPTEGGTTVVIRGYGLRDIREVRFDGVRAPWIDARSAHRLVVLTPAAATTGPVDVTLRGAGVHIRVPDGYTFAYPGVGTWF